MTDIKILLIPETIFFSKNNLRDWKNKTLLNKWKQQYPSLIQDHLINKVLNRKIFTTHCFGELFTGIHYAEKGYKFLYEPWIENFLLVEAKRDDLKKLQEKFINIFIEHAGVEVTKFIKNEIAKKINKGQPDLFVYNEAHCFFVEVKRENDVLSEEQKIFANMLNQSNFDLPIKLISLNII